MRRVIYADKRNAMRLLSSFIGIAVVAMIGAAYLWGLTWISNTLLPLVLSAVVPIEILAAAIGGVLACFRKTRAIAGLGFQLTSFVPGAAVWMWSFLLVYTLWGSWAVAVGFFFMGIGVVPMAVVATALNGGWGIAGQIIFLILLTFGQRVLGGFLIAKAAESREGISKSDKLAA